MPVAEAFPDGGDTASLFPFGGSCSLPGHCGTLRRTVLLPEEYAHRAADLLPAAALVLGRKYSNSTAFRIGVRRSSWSPADRSAALAVTMPSSMTARQVREEVARTLTGLTAAPAPLPDTVPPTLHCVLDGPADDRHGFDLSLSVESRPGQRTALHLDCHEHIHDSAFADRMLGHLVTLLGQLDAEPDVTIAGLRLLTDPERSRLRELSSGTRQKPYPSESSIYTLFAEQADAHPDREAVSHDEGTLTYRELQEQALTLALALHARGVRPHDRVAFLLDKTPRLLVAMLAVLRLGAAYVPIAAGVPERRRAYLLADSGACLLLSEGPAPATDIPVLDLAQTYAITDAGHRLPDPVTGPLDAAYVMYTSGTTGRPKGVLVNQRAVVRLVKNTDYVRLSSDTRILQTGAIAFDATTFEFWGALLNGGTVALVPSEEVVDAAGLGAALARHRADTLFLTTALFHQIVEQEPSVLAGCQVLIGGETLSARHLTKAMDACPGSEFINVYGPTENTTFSVTHPVTARYTGRVPIGRPIARSTAYVLDLDGNPQPLGVPGELYVGGDGLGDGYLNRPELNATAFVRGGAGEEPERLYRTGDLALWNESGQLEFLGRTDHQVKIRGYRIELAEVESQLTRLPGVREAVVLLRRRGADLSLLSAYVTADGPVDAEALREGLLEELPDHMVPAEFTQVDAMPLNRNQKIDRATLAALDPVAAAPVAARLRAPRTATEVTVAAVFAEVLGVPSVSLDDNFFDMGGHSLLATRLWSRLRSALGREFQLRQILDTPTVGGLVASLERDGASTVARPKLVRRSS
ncbi:amino acid adenylation domain-containing protein [Streptomyces sp. NPDC088915]|uniref:amino acid adenylation domain-containing protein n=1 Tax=Streptomyces sp. NPDC088915 TaxID=3365912 RepID=UPI0037FB63EB